MFDWPLASTQSAPTTGVSGRTEPFVFAPLLLSVNRLTQSMLVNPPSVRHSMSIAVHSGGTELTSSAPSTPSPTTTRRTHGQQTNHRRPETPPLRILRRIGFNL